MGYPGGTIGKEHPCQCRIYKRDGFNPLGGKSPWRRAWQPTPVCLSGESHGLGSLMGHSPVESQRVRHDWNNLAWTHAQTHAWVHWISCYFIFQSTSLHTLMYVYTCFLTVQLSQVWTLFGMSAVFLIGEETYITTSAVLRHDNIAWMKCGQLGKI